MNCERCNHKIAKGKVRCPSCGKWHVREVASADKQGSFLSQTKGKKPNRIKTGPWDVCFGPAKRCPKCASLQEQDCPHFRELNGVVETSVNLIGGVPGAGKSTLSLQAADGIVYHFEKKRNLLYVCSEQAVEEVAEYADRLEVECTDRIFGISTLTGSEALLELESIIEDKDPCATIVDSLSGLTKDLAAQVQVAKMLKPIAVKRKMPVFLIDHATKADDLAGSEDLQHEVDGTFTFCVSAEDGDMRVLETQKNRNGRAFVSCYLMMTETGLVECQKVDSAEEAG